MQDLRNFLQSTCHTFETTCPNEKDGTTLIELYAYSKVDNVRPMDEKPWNYSVYVLDPKLQDCKRLPKWKSRTHRGQYFEKLQKFTSSTGLLRNLETRYIWSQFLVVYATRFKAVTGEGGMNIVKER